MEETQSEYEITVTYVLSGLWLLFLELSEAVKHDRYIPFVKIQIDFMRFIIKLFTFQTIVVCSKHLNTEGELLFKIELSYAENKSPQVIIFAVNITDSSMSLAMDGFTYLLPQCKIIIVMREQIGMLCGLNYLALCGRNTEELRWEE